MPKLLTRELKLQLFRDLERLLLRWVDRGHCRHCLAGTLLMHAGFIAAHELGQDDMMAALEYIVEESDEHCPSQGVRH